MKAKNVLVILISAIAIIAIGFLVSIFMNWPVDRSNAGGNIAKASRFSRQTAAGSLNTMEELILNDENYKNDIVVSYVVMQTRAQQFSGLVDLSNEVAGEIPAFTGVLGKMNEVREMADNVCTSLQKAGESLNAVLAGESRPEMGQETNNAAVDYLTLQKQNKLATQFIDTADRYLAENEGSDQLKFVRDQWVGYQMMTASLEGDSELEKAMTGKGILLTQEQSALALQVLSQQVPDIRNTPVMEITGLDSFTGLGAMSFIHEQYHMLSIPQVQEVFNNVYLGISEAGSTAESINVADNMVRNQVGMYIRNIAEGNADIR